MYCIRIYKSIYSIMYAIVWYIQFLIQHPHICIDSPMNIFFAPFISASILGNNWSYFTAISWSSLHLWPGAVVAREPFFSVFWVFCLSPLPSVAVVSEEQKIHLYFAVRKEHWELVRCQKNRWSCNLEILDFMELESFFQCQASEPTNIYKYHDLVTEDNMTSNLRPPKFLFGFLENALRYIWNLSPKWPQVPNHPTPQALYPETPHGTLQSCW